MSARSVRWRSFRPKRLHALAVAAAALCACDGAAALTRYKCRLPDGSFKQVEQDVAERFPSLVLSCQRIEVEAFEDLEETIPDYGSPGGVRVIRAPSSRLAATATPAELRQLIEASAQRHGVDAALVQAVIQVESAFQHRARSPKGALGLMQLMPATAARFGAEPGDDLFDPALNIDIGVRYLRVLTERFGRRVDLVLAAYNAGEGAVIRHGYRVPPYRETQDYVQKILGLLSAR